MGLNITEKVTAVVSPTHVRVVVDHTVPTPLQRSTKLKISHWYFDQCLYTPSRLHLLSKTPSTSGFLRIFFAHIYLIICLSSMVNMTAVLTLLLMSGRQTDGHFRQHSPRYAQRCAVKTDEYMKSKSQLVPAWNHRNRSLAWPCINLLPVPGFNRRASWTRQIWVCLSVDLWFCCLLKSTWQT